MEDYVAIIPTDPQFVPTEDAISAGLAHLESLGIIRRAGDGWESGPNLADLVRDPNPPLVDGESVLKRAGHAVAWSVHPHVVGHAGVNLEPIACRHCNSELPFDEMLDAFEQARGDSELTPEQRSLTCFHCERGNDAVDYEYGSSAGFARFACTIAVPTHRQMQGDATILGDLGRILGCELKLIQVLHS